MSIRINNKIISGTYTAQSYRYVGEIFQSALPIQDSRVALLDGRKIYESEGYGSFIQYITSLALLYPQLSCTEDEWQLSDTTYGECGKFVISEDCVRLPKIVNFVQGLSSLQDLATLVEAGLPNIEGKFISGANSTQPSEDVNSGAFYKDSITGDSLSGGSFARQGVTFDASLSNPIYGNSDTVQPQSIRYPYYIVLATGVTQEVKVKEELTTNIPFTLFESKYSEVDLNNTSWLLSNGQWNSKELYPSAYNELLKEYNTPTDKYNIKLYTDEYTDYDFVLNLDDETFRLPLLNGSESLIGDRYDELELLASGSTYTVPANGFVDFIKTCTTVNEFVAMTTISENGVKLLHTKSTSGSAGNTANIYAPVKKGDSFQLIYTATGTAVSSLRFVYTQGNGSLYFYVGDTNINVSLVDTGKLTQEVANLIPNNSGLISGYSMPSDRYINLTLGASGTEYTAPANGWLYIWKEATAVGQYVVFTNQTSPMANIIYAPTNSTQCRMILPLKKGNIVKIDYTLAGNTRSFRFIYTEGEK